MARTTKDPRKHLVAVRLTDAERDALKYLAKHRGDRYLSDALRSLIPVLAAPTTAESPAQRSRPRKRGRG
jgi:hypothetical protein